MVHRVVVVRVVVVVVVKVVVRVALYLHIDDQQRPVVVVVVALAPYHSLLTYQVIREGQEIRIPPQDLVPGDIVRLNLGDRVPADVRLIAVSPGRGRGAVLAVPQPRYWSPGADLSRLPVAPRHAHTRGRAAEPLRAQRTQGPTGGCYAAVRPGLSR